MQSTINSIKAFIGIIGGFLGMFIGGFDSLVQALLIFVIADYATGVVYACLCHKLSSEVGFKGIAKKVLIFVLVGIGHILDTQVIKSGTTIRTMVIFFYLANEGISLLENVANIGLPVPEKLKEVLEQLSEED